MADGQSETPTGGIEGGGGLLTPNKWVKRPQVNIHRNERLKRNVLEINIDTDQKSCKIEKEAVAKLFSCMGLKAGAGGDLEGFQIKRKKVYAWLLEGSDLGKYCTDEVFKIAPGIKTTIIKPMDRREVQVTISGLNINTPDSFIFSYVAFFGKLHSFKVIYDREREGPLAGIKNGDRRVMVDFTGARGMGTYHLMDGEAVTINYSGQRRTCGRCHKDSRSCPGGGWARRCEEMATPRVDLKDHMRQLWAEVGFKADTFELAEGSGEVMEEDIEKEASSFTPPPRAQPSQAAKERYTGVQVRNFPLQVDIEEVMELLEKNGLPKGMRDNVKFFKKKRNSQVDIDLLSAEVCNKMIENLDNQISIWDQKLLHCVGATTVSPTKQCAPIPAPPTAHKTPTPAPGALKSLIPPPATPSETPQPQAPKSTPRGSGPPAPLPLPPTAQSSSLPPKSSLPGPLPKVSLPPAPSSPAPPNVQQLSRLSGVKITEVVRPSKSERAQLEKKLKKKENKIMKVATPGSKFFHGDSSSGEESEEESKKEEKNLEKRFVKDSSASKTNVTEIKAALTGKHKLSPEQSVARNTKNRLSSSGIVGLGHN